MYSSYNITSTNEKETFSFHDCFILETKHINDDITIFLSHVDVLKNNSENNTDSAKQTDKAMLKIYDFRINNIYEQIPLSDDEREHHQKNKKVYLSLNKYEIENTLKDSIIMYCGFEDDNSMILEILNGNRLIVFEAEFLNFEVKWNEFVKESWFVKI